MAYLGSTQLSSVANPPVLLASGRGAGAAEHIAGSTGVYQGNAYPSTAAYHASRQFGQQLWMYHTTDMTSAILAAGYFTDAGPLGVRPGDVFMMVSQSGTATSSQMLRLAVVSAISTAGAASFSTATTIMGAS